MITNKEYIKKYIIGHQIKDIKVKTNYSDGVEFTKAYMLLDNDLIIDLGEYGPVLKIIDSPPVAFTDWKSFETTINLCCECEYRDIKIVDVLRAEYYPFLFWKLNNGATIYYTDYGPNVLGPIVMDISDCDYFNDNEVYTLC